MMDLLLDSKKQTIIRHVLIFIASVLMVSIATVFSGEEEKLRQEEEDKKPQLYTDSATGMEFVLVKGGCYEMGDTFGDGYKDEKPVHEVCVGDFHIGKYEVTQGQWEAIMGNNPSFFKKGPNSLIGKPLVLPVRLSKVLPSSI